MVPLVVRFSKTFFCTQVQNAVTGDVGEHVWWWPYGGRTIT